MELEQLKTMFDVSDIVGKPIEIDKRTTAVPISKISYGYVGGDGKYDKTENENKLKADVNGFGMTVTPLGVLVFGDKTAYIKIDESYAEDKWLGLIKSVVSTFQKYQFMR